MADIELVIKIPEGLYNDMKSLPFITFSEDIIINGTPLSKMHGKLIDADELVKNIVKEYGVNSIYELPQDIKIFYDKFISSEPTILDATFDYKLKNYAFFRKGEEK